ncbi:MAG TPA: apolipoprotein N-acyltransferase [Planctomycetaceae bacterium]|nr:apolipoprotein N-acyltransferase [Planctomycetaceae bacterium]
MASGVLLAVSFRADELSPLAFLGLLPIAGALSRCAQLPATYVGAYCGGLAFNLITADWMRTLNGAQGLAGHSALNWMRQALALAICWPATIFLGRLFIRAMPWLRMSISLPLVWLCHESLVRYGSVLIDETGWPFYFLGYSTGPYVALHQIVDISGVSTASMLVVCINGGLWDIWQVIRRWNSCRQPTLTLVRALVLPTLLLLASYGYGRWRLKENDVQAGPSVMLMPSGSLDTSANCDRCVAAALKNPRPDLMLWPEAAFVRPILIPKALVTPELISKPSRVDAANRVDAASRTSLSDIEQVAKSVGASIILGCIRADDGSVTRQFNSAVFIDPRIGCRGYYDKVYLVPEREFIPSTVFFSGDRSLFERGTELPVFILEGQEPGRAFAFGMSICYDIAFPHLYRQYMRQGPRAPDFFTVCSSEGADWTGRLARDLLTVAEFRAIECRRTIVRNVYSGYSGIIDSAGRLQIRNIDWNIARPTFIECIPIDSRKTLFILLGDWLSISCAIAVGSAVLVCGARWLAGRAIWVHNFKIASMIAFFGVVAVETLS